MRRRQLFAGKTRTPPALYANRGRWFQQLLDASCRHYQAQGRAYIHPVPVPIRMRSGGESAFYARKGTTDYIGFLPARMRPKMTGPLDHLPTQFEQGNPIEDMELPPVGVAFDAKSTVGYEWGAAIPDHQLEVLALVSQLGHKAGILVGFGSTRGAPPVAIWIPWPAAKQLVHSHWSQQKLLALPGARTVSWTGFIDFLPVLLA